MPPAGVTPSSPAPFYLCAEQVIEVLPVSRRTLSNWQSRRLIKFYRVGRTVLFKRTDIEACLERYAVQPIGEPRLRFRRIVNSAVAGETPPQRKRRAGRIQPVSPNAQSPGGATMPPAS